MRDDLQERLKPIVEEVAAQLADKVAAIATDIVRERLMSLIDGAPAASHPARPVTAKPKAIAIAPAKRREQIAARSVKAAPIAKGAGPACSKCGQPGHNSRSCGRDPKGNPHGKRPKPAAADDEDSGATDLVHQKQQHVVGLDVAVDDPLPASLEVVQAIAEATLPNPLDKREVCPRHGWVGRSAFQRSHVLCERRVEPELQAPVIDEPARPTMGVLVKFYDEDGNRHCKRTDMLRSKTIATKGLTHTKLAEGAAELDAKDFAALEAERPRTRAECKDGPRPCPFVACKHHLFLDVNPETGSIKLNFPDRELEDMVETCALDIADRGEQVLETVAEMLNITRERTRQLEVLGLHKLKGSIAAD